jgi:hypothetical protein
MKRDFNEEYVSEHQDELDGKKLDFDYDAVDLALGFVNETVEDRDLPAMAAAVKMLLAMIVEGRYNPRHHHRSAWVNRISRRALMLAWVLDPSLIEGSPSLSEVARDLKCHKVTLSVHSAEFRRRLGIHNRAQSHGWSFDPDKDPTTLTAHPDDIEHEEHDEDQD